MHPEALKKLWACTQGQVPHLTRRQLDDLLATSGAIDDSSRLEYWGVVAESVRYRGHMLLHCYNFGNTSAQCPWPAHLVNFGQALPARVLACGTVRLREPLSEAPLDKFQQPYLVFGYEMDPASSEFLESGMLVSRGTVPEQRRSYDVVFPDDPEPPTHSGVMWYYLMKRISFTVGPADRWVAPGAPAGYPRVRITLQHPIVLEPGWPVLLLEKHRWLWGVVTGT